MLCCGGLATIGALASPRPEPAPTRSAEAAPAPSPSTSPSPSSPSPSATSVDAAEIPSPIAESTPAIEKRTISERQPIPFATKRVNDSSLAKGTTRVRTAGVTGIKTLTYEVTFTNGVETGKRLLRAVITKAPVTRVLAVGTKELRRCDPNYGGACVPIASDVDCAGGTGDGPAYVVGPVRVIGSDIYRLDHDHDGIGCED